MFKFVIMLNYFPSNKYKSRLQYVSLWFRRHVPDRRISTHWYIIYIYSGGEGGEGFVHSR